VRAKGGAKVQVLPMHVGQSDFSEIVAAVRAFDAELVYIGATEVEGSKLTIALRAAGVAAQVLTSEGGPHNPFTRLAGAAAEGSVHTYAGADPSSTPAARGLAERCAREFGEAPSFMVECYDAVTTVAAALAGGRGTRGDVRDAIARTDIDGLAGRIQFDPNGDRIDAPVSLWRVEGGRMVPLTDWSAPSGAARHLPRSTGK
jgi:branched-chain amino acid transport system substrate-binding protein